ncbi:adenine phosphoribosyltransferase-like [Gouania willdenowi]|uniref:Adenine phosphoribosyltransferase n=1 Tax=Gouania willdenowi TaxID=441366 RepID=A0A8C5H750_GOUWI|nr:adenine phosphoribosyltransferase-like [Gouania willdenowi]
MSETNLFESKLELVRSHIRSFPDFPKKGIVFRDVCPILKNPAALAALTDLFEEHVRTSYQQVDLIVGLDARGFLFGPLLAQRLGLGFVLIRKKGKLPGSTTSVTFDLEYGQAEVEIQDDVVDPGQKVLIIDDLLATGGTLCAAWELLKQQQAEVLGCLVVIELLDLQGKNKVKPLPVFSLTHY